MAIRLDGAVLAMFPGQGSQRRGMAAALCADHPEAAAVFATADATLGLPITELCTTGDEADLRRTELTQPAVVATSLAIWNVLQANDFEPDMVAGHSLGEFAALAAAGVLTYEQALRLVARRGELMAEVAQRVPGAMLAVIGLSAETVEQLCDRVVGADVANYNEPEQTVVSGTVTALAEIERTAGEAGAHKCVWLEVGAPFHSSLMDAIAAEFGAELDRHRFADPRLPVLSSVTAAPVRTGAEAEQLLRRQLSGGVQWVAVVRTAIAEGCTTLLEVGPGRALTGFAKRIAPELAVFGTGTTKSLDAVVAALATSRSTAA
ncbi:[acyl-carrier-protein] S-malonyltransferase [Nocardia tenerifensis]|uniref:Malonyl CoA-acyl carrier protein transacylase n=1 Tax=Nocardia tenerifensis TaxID=228006 RepID=A0A318JU49_9NOCA|nr:ACP S-malonyltransferase [Nocardia tenerifensis]PXX55553.1 [acyl-carrier-protein] S-malonyltransferase [Nocardia tenerifensis]